MDRNLILKIINEVDDNAKGIIDVSQKMNIDIPKLIYEKIIIKKDELEKESVIKNILGVYGNYLATKYFLNKGYDVLNEYPVLDKEGKVVTNADLYFIDNDGIKNYCEVKAATQIIEDDSSYIDNILLNEEDKKEEILKYKSIGKKLIKQSTELFNTGFKVNVIIFNGCNLDEKIKEQLLNINVNIIVLDININELEKNIKLNVEKICDIYRSFN